MKAQTFFKGLFMALMSVVVMYFSQTPVDYLMLGIAAVSTVLVYSGKNLITLLHSDSPLWKLNLVNYVSGAILALGTAALDSAAKYIIEGAVAWDVAWKLALSVLLTYLAGTLVTEPHAVKTPKP